jgi:hypothetical protein
MCPGWKFRRFFWRLRFTDRGELAASTTRDSNHTNPLDPLGSRAISFVRGNASETHRRSARNGGSSENFQRPGFQPGRNRIGGHNQPLGRANDVRGPEVENRHVSTKEGELVRVTHRKTSGSSLKPSSSTIIETISSRVAASPAMCGWRVTIPRLPAVSSHADEGNCVGKKLILQHKPLQVFERQGRCQRRSAGIERNNISRSRRLCELEPERSFFVECEIVLPSALFQRLEVFEEAPCFFRSLDESSEAFVINGPFVDFAIRSTWA